MRRREDVAAPVWAWHGRDHGHLLLKAHLETRHVKPPEEISAVQMHIRVVYRRR